MKYVNFLPIFHFEMLKILALRRIECHLGLVAMVHPVCIQMIEHASSRLEQFSHSGKIMDL